MALLSKTLKDLLERKLDFLNALRPLPRSAIEKLRDHFKIEMTYNSNAIEGNSLTLKETFLVINEGLTIKGKSLKDHLEAKDHHAALEYLYELVEYKKRETISEHLIRTLHQLVTRETEEEWAGRYRESNVIIGGADHTPPDALDVPMLMRELMQWFQKNQKKFHVVELAALFHHRLVHIHPFLDGNGRTARLAMNVLLMKAGYPLVVILKNDRKKYYRVLSEADQGKPALLVQFIAQSVERALNIYLKVLTPTSKKREKFLPLSEIAKGSHHSQKYLNLLIRQGKLEAHKEGRIWLTSREALLRYREGRQRKRR
ncbi:MAG: Fic family protein [Deltaproteobacteria bacterium]|nr:Fic family protein [Deltaproteobacteria bacterium]